MGKSKTLASTLGSSVLSTKERAANDYYATDPRALEMLLEREAFTHDVWEPACGEGNLSKVLTEAGYSVRSTDLIDRGYGTGGVDFLNETEVWHGDIVTNPPYIYALEFVKKSLDLLEDGHKTAFFLRLQFLEGKKRRVFFDSAPPPIRVYVFSSRMRCARNGVFAASGDDAVCFAWFIWEKGFKGKPVIEWI